MPEQLQPEELLVVRQCVLGVYPSSWYVDSAAFLKLGTMAASKEIMHCASSVGGRRVFDGPLHRKVETS
jgi:hypothetical protein